MQAIIIFAIFGFVAAIIGGLVAQTSETTQALMAGQVQAQQQSFHDIELVSTQRITPNNYEMPGSAGQTNPAIYVCNRPELRQLVTCRTSGGVTQAIDQWGNPLQGYMRRVMKPVYAYGANGSSNTGNASIGVFTVNVPVTALVLVSAGPDGKLDNRLGGPTGTLTQLPAAGGDVIRNILNIAAFKDSTGNNSLDSLDDIVMTFSDQGAQAENLDELRSNLNRVATAVLHNYQTRFRQFTPQLSGVYDRQFDTHAIDVNAAMDAWRTSGSAPSFNGVGTADLGRFGANAEIDSIQRPVAAGGGNYIVNAAGLGERLDLSLSQNGTLPWTMAGSNCNALPSPVNCLRITF